MVAEGEVAKAIATSTYVGVAPVDAADRQQHAAANHAKNTSKSPATSDTSVPIDVLVAMMGASLGGMIVLVRRRKLKAKQKM